MANNIMNLVLDVLKQLPALIKDGEEAIQLVESTLATVRQAQAQGRDPTVGEWDAIHAQIDTMTGQLNKPEEAPVGTGLPPAKPMEPLTGAKPMEPLVASKPVEPLVTSKPLLTPFASHADDDLVEHDAQGDKRGLTPFASHADDDLVEHEQEDLSDKAKRVFGIE